MENRIVDPKLAAFYEKVRTIVSGPLFSRERWRYIAELNLTPSRRFTAPYRGLRSIPPWMRQDAER